MIKVTSQSKVLIATMPVDFRKQIDGLVSLCKHQLIQNPKNGTFFVFINKSKTSIRVLTYDGSGYWLHTKRLSNGKYNHWPTPKTPISSINAEHLMQLLKSTICNSSISPIS